jgi:hypothetical protein
MVNYYARLIILAIFIYSFQSQLIAQSENNLYQNPKGTLCVPEYSSGCGFGDGFTDFAVAEIENYNSGCSDNTTFPGWSQYLELGPAILLGGQTYDFMMQTGYADQFVTIWIDFNDDLELTPDEKIMNDFSMENSGQMYTMQATIPADAFPGFHIMRARTNWQGSCSDPCAEYGYGEAEDYMVIVGEAAFGSLEGIVTELAGGDPVDAAEVSSVMGYSYSTFTGSDGTYQINTMLIGEYVIGCFKEGYNILTDTITIEEGITTTLDFQLTQPNISIDPLSVSTILAPNAMGEETVFIQNSGDGELSWSASILMNSKEQREIFDLQFQYPAEGSTGEAGIETDGTYIYTSQWNGGGFYKYDLDGNFIEEFTIPDTYFIRDLAYDGTYFYGGASTSEVYEMDFDGQDLIRTFTAPTTVRAIAYNDVEDVFYANDWSSPVKVFDRTGTELGSFNVGPSGGEYYGFAFDNTSLGGPFLWGYAQLGSSQNELIQIQLPSGIETGFSIDVSDKLSGTIWGDAGGLFTHPHLVTGKTTLGGLVQGQWIWGLELGDASTWLSVNPVGGTIGPGGEQEALLMFDATDLEFGVYEAEVHLNTWPDVGTPIINVTLTVTEMIPDPPTNLTGEIDCDEFELCWEVDNADSCSVYNNGTLVASTEENCYTLAGPGDYETFVTAWLGGNQSAPSDALTFEIPVPANLEPVNFSIDDVNGSIVIFSWDIPAGCAMTDGYNMYRDGEKINTQTIMELIFADTMDVGGTYEYYATAVYYFGESSPSNIERIVLTSIQELDDTGFSVSPNPFTDVILLEFDLPNPGKTTIRIYDQLGNLQKIFTRECQNSGKQNIELNADDLPAGVYFCELETGEGVWTKKMIKL